MKINKITLAVLLALSGQAYAELNRALPDVEVTASPLIESIDIDAYSSSSALITDKQIKDLNAVDIASALRTTPGVEISRYNPVGGYGGDQGGGVYIRGLGTSRPGSEIKTYVDGVPFYSPVWGHSLLDILPVNGMSSITVYKSPQPQINGNNYASINLTSKSAIAEGVHGEARLTGGSFGTVTEQASVSVKKDNINFVLSEGFMKSNGHRANADGELKNVMGRLGVDFNQNWNAYATFLYTDNYAKDPNPSNLQNGIAPKYATDAGMMTVGIAHQYENLRGDLKAYYTEGSATWNNSPSFAWRYKQEFDTAGFRFKEEYNPWIGGSILAGLDYDSVSGKSNSVTSAMLDMPNLRITSPYFALSQAVVLNDTWSLVPSAGVRFYEHNVYSSKTAPHAGLSLVSDRATFFVNASKGINYPGQEAVAVVGYAGSNWQTLSANEMNHYEAGFKVRPIQGTQFDASVFHDEVESRWVYSYGSAGARGGYTTSGDHTNGAELALKQQVGADWLLTAAYTWLDPNSSLNLPYMPKSSIAVGLNGHVGEFKVAFDAQHQTKMYANTATRVFEWSGGVLGNTQQVKGFTVANIRVSYPVPALGKKAELFVAAENLFDEKYEYAPAYAMPGISAQLGVSASF